MILNEDTYSYIKQASNQIEGLICALVVFIENAGGELEGYHYEAFNKFANAVRELEINATKEVKREYETVHASLEQEADRIKASESSISKLKKELNEIEELFSRLVIHSENIRVFDSDTSNPYVPDANEEVYQAFSGYRKFLSQYVISKPDEQDTFASLFYSFSETAMSIFESLFSEYDRMLREFGVDVEENKKNIMALRKVKEREGNKEIAKAMIGVATTVACARLGIKKKNAFDVVEQGIGLVGKINDTLEGLDKLSFAKPKKSLARNAIKAISTYNDAMELVGNFANAFGVGDETPTLAKMVMALEVVRGNADSLIKMKESGSLDVLNKGLATAGSLVSIGVSLATGKAALDIIKKIPALGSNGLGLIEKTAKYLSDEKCDRHIKPKNVDDVLHGLGKQLNDYNKKVEKYKIDKERKRVAQKKPKAPPFITATGIVDKIKKGLDYYEDGCELVNSEAFKGIDYIKKGSEIFENIKGIL